MHYWIIEQLVVQWIGKKGQQSSFIVRFDHFRSMLLVCMYCVQISRFSTVLSFHVNPCKDREIETDPLPVEGTVCILPYEISSTNWVIDDDLLSRATAPEPMLELRPTSANDSFCPALNTPVIVS